jgi:SAM-dependent methyltransferase
MCQLCGAKTCKPRYPLRPHAVVACAECGLYQLDPPVSTEKLSKLTEQAYHGDTFAEISKFNSPPDITDLSDPTVAEHISIIEALETITKGRNLLDVGCGSGDLMAIARDRGWNVCGLDFCLVPVQAAKEQHGLEALCCSFEEYKADAGSFDAIVMLDVLEHASSLKNTLKKAIHLLKDGGAIAFSFPNRKSLVYMLADLLYRTRISRLQRPLLLLYDVAVCHTIFPEPGNVSALCELYGLDLVSMQLRNPDIGRLNLSALASLELRIINSFSRMFRLQSRLVAIAKKGPQSLNAKTCDD